MYRKFVERTRRDTGHKTAYRWETDGSVSVGELCNKRRRLSGYRATSKQIARTIIVDDMTSNFELFNRDFAIAREQEDVPVLVSHLGETLIQFFFSRVCQGLTVFSAKGKAEDFLNRLTVK